MIFLDYFPLMKSPLHNCSEENEKRKEEESTRKFQRGLMIGLGAIGGGALIGKFASMTSSIQNGSHLWMK
jgi:hypothetical protein